MVSRFRSPVDIIGLTSQEGVWRKLALSWGVTPVLTDAYPSTDVLFYVAKNTAKEVFGLESGNCVIITGGATNGESGNTDLIKIEKI